MVKKIISCLASCALAIMAFAEVDSLKMRVVPVSSVQWASIHNQMTTNGWCHIKEQNVLLVITNGCPNVEHLLPIFPPKPEIDLERNPLKVEGKRGEDGKEPMPYQDQGL